MKTYDLKLPAFLDDRGCLLKVRTFESGDIHQSWLLPDGKVISFEDIPANYPSGSLCIWDTLDEYVDAIEGIWWMNDPEYILHYADELEAFGFPFEEEEEEFEDGRQPIPE